MANAQSASHLRPEELAAWLTAGPRASAQARIQAHLAECAECREEAIAVRRLTGASARRARWPLAPLALAAGVALVAWFGTGSPEPAVLRDASAPRGSVAATLPQPVAPTGSVSRPSGPFFFQWRSWPGSVEYRITLLDAAGSVLWTAATVDTTLALPLAISLAPGESYFWYVDALQPDGGSATSGAQAFVLTP